TKLRSVKCPVAQSRRQGILVFNGFANFKPFKPANAMVSIIFRRNHKSASILQPTDRYSPLIP
ncbi:hypothetical protein LIZ85_19745, partial [[Eubacterium] rectale]|nr:hypothetical protein [Agathobacter rectalis]